MRSNIYGKNITAPLLEQELADRGYYLQRDCKNPKWHKISEMNIDVQEQYVEQDRPTLTPLQEILNFLAYQFLDEPENWSEGEKRFFLKIRSVLTLISELKELEGESKMLTFMENKMNEFAESVDYSSNINTLKVKIRDKESQIMAFCLMPKIKDLTSLFS